MAKAAGLRHEGKGLPASGQTRMRQIELSNPEPTTRGEDDADRGDNLDVNDYIDRGLQEREETEELSSVCTHVVVPIHESMFGKIGF